MWEVTRRHINEQVSETEGPFDKYADAYALYIQWRWMNSSSWMIELRQDSQVIMRYRGTDDGRG